MNLAKLYKPLYEKRLQEFADYIEKKKRKENESKGVEIICLK